MEHEIVADDTGVIQRVAVEPGQTVQEGELLAIVDHAHNGPGEVPDGHRPDSSSTSETTSRPSWSATLSPWMRPVPRRWRSATAWAGGPPGRTWTI